MQPNNITAFYDDAERQFLEVDWGGLKEFHGAYTPRSGSIDDQIREVLENVSINLRSRELDCTDMAAARIFAATPDELDQFEAKLKEKFGFVPPMTRLIAKPCEPEARIAFEYEAFGGASVTFFGWEFDHIMGSRVRFNGVEYVFLRDMGGAGSEGIPEDALEEARLMYARQRRLLGGAGCTYAQVARVHLFVADIDSETINNYRPLNLARKENYEKVGITKNWKASTGMGLESRHGRFSSDLFVQVGVQITTFDNPLQAKTTDYKVKHGVKDMIVQFSRGAVSDRVLASGHSTIVGGYSVHTDDIRKAARQTFQVGEILVAQQGMTVDNAIARRVYIKDASDYGTYSRERREWVGFPAPEVVVVGDICRGELPIEYGFMALAGERFIMHKGDLVPYIERQPIVDLNFIPRGYEPEIRRKIPGLLDRAEVIPARPGERLVLPEND